VPKVSDFGVAKVLDSTAKQTRAGTGLGTPAYMAPEQMRDASTVGPRADVFSLGAILYELVTGRMAFEGADLLEVLQLVAKGEYRAPRDLEPELPPRMEQAIAAALQRDPERRPADAGALLELWTDGTTLPVQPWDVAALTLLRSVSEQHQAQRIVTPRSRALSPDDPAANLPTKLTDRRELPARPSPRPPPPRRRSRWVWVAVGSSVAFLAAAVVLALGAVIAAIGLWSLQ
jgi:serine/threonine protein kinase